MQSKLQSAAATQDWVDLSGEETIDIRRALGAINEAVPRDRTFVTDVGRFVIESWIRIDAPEPFGFPSNTRVRLHRHRAPACDRRCIGP